MPTTECQSTIEPLFYGISGNFEHCILQSSPTSCKSNPEPNPHNPSRMNKSQTAVGKQEHYRALGSGVADKELSGGDRCVPWSSACQATKKGINLCIAHKIQNWILSEPTVEANYRQNLTSYSSERVFYDSPHLALNHHTVRRDKFYGRNAPRFDTCHSREMHEIFRR